MDTIFFWTAKKQMIPINEYKVISFYILVSVLVNMITQMLFH